MAVTKKTSVDEKKKDAIEVVEKVKGVETSETSVEVKPTTSKANEENEILKKRLADMEQQMSMFMKMVGNNMSDSQSANDRDIEVVSLITGRLVLTTTGLDSGQKYEFGNQFDTILIPESDLRAIVRFMPETARGGYFYIADHKFIEDVKLTGAYRNMMSKNELLDIFNKSHDEFMTTYKASSEGQKKIIEDMVIGKKLNGEFVDANILIELGKVCNRDFMSIETLENLMG